MKENSQEKIVDPALELRIRELSKYLIFMRKMQDEQGATFLQSLGNLAMQELNILNIIGDTGPCTMSDIAKMAGLSLSSVTVIVDKLVKHFEIRGLERDKVAYVFRGDPRPLEIILKEGITSKSPHSRTNLLVHRYRNEFSGFISFSTKLSVAARFGCLSSIHSTYGIHPTIGNNQFHILYAELPGNQYILAGPSKGPRFFASEFEVTCGSTINPRDIKGFRKCEFTKQRIGQFEQRYATCLNIFVRKGLTPQEEERVTHLLEGQDPKKLETHMQLRK